MLDLAAAGISTVLWTTGYTAGLRLARPAGPRRLRSAAPRHGGVQRGPGPDVPRAALAAQPGLGQPERRRGRCRIPRVPLGGSRQRRGRIAYGTTLISDEHASQMSPTPSPPPIAMRSPTCATSPPSASVNTMGSVSRAIQPCGQRTGTRGPSSNRMPRPVRASTASVPGAEPPCRRPDRRCGRRLCDERQGLNLRWRGLEPAAAGDDDREEEADRAPPHRSAGSTTCARPRGTSRDRSRCGRAARRRAGARWRGSATRASARWCFASRRSAAAWSASTASSSASTSPVHASLRQHGRSTSRSTPLSASSSRIARSPRGRARSRDSTQARANASSSSIPSSSSRAIGAVDEIGPVARRVSRRRTSATDRERASRNRAAASSTTAGSSTAARRLPPLRVRPSTPAARPRRATRPLRCPRPGARRRPRRSCRGSARSISAATGRVRLQEVLRRLAALAEPGLVEGEPRARLGHDVHRDADVEEAALLRDALAVHDVELGDPERRRDLVLDDLDPDPVADRLGAGLDRLDRAGCRAGPRRRTSARGRRASSPDCRTSRRSSRAAGW